MKSAINRSDRPHDFCFEINPQGIYMVQICNKVDYLVEQLFRNDKNMNSDMFWVKIFIYACNTTENISLDYLYIAKYL